MSAGCRHIVLSVDYEIFGNGTGDVRHHVVHPAERLARLGEDHGVPFTFFFEVEEYLAFARYADPLKKELNYDPACLMREQAVSLVRRGHDVQMHLHPQWYGARYERGQWTLDETHSTVDSLLKNQRQVTRYIADRKTVLDNMLAEAEPARRAQAYRAGAFAAQPGQRLLKALADNHIVIESSVVRGLYRCTSEASFDYRNAPSGKRLWTVSSDVSVEDTGGGIWEIPIHAVMRRRAMQASVRRFKAKFSKHVPKERRRAMVHELGIRWNPVHLLGFLWQKVPVKLDFHNVSPDTLVKWMRADQGMGAGDPIDVLVLIGHTKEHRDDCALRRFLGLVSRDPDFKVVTFDYLARILRERSVRFGAKP
jgi:hypothetical protein